MKPTFLALTSALDSSDDEDDPGSVTQAVGAAAAAVQNVAAQAAVAAAAVRTTRTKPQPVYLQASPNGSGDESEPGAAGQDATLGAGALGAFNKFKTGVLGVVVSPLVRCAA